MTLIQFQQKTQIFFKSNVSIDLNLSCEAISIGDKVLIVEINSSEELEINMTCKEEEKELGLLKGNLYQIKNRDRQKYLEGFVFSLECNNSFQAKLKLKATNENRAGTWVYYNEDTSEWIAVETIVEDEYLVAETDHFSTWTVLIPDPDYSLIIIIGIGVGVGAIVAIVIVLRKRKE
jgi:hypothetical protein